MSDTRQFADRCAVVTGGSQGLGAATARMLAQRGAAGIVLGGRNVSRGAAVAAEVKELGAACVFEAGDLTSVGHCRALVERAEAEFGGLHVLVNVGALTERGTIWDTTPELFDKIIATNTRAPFFLMQEAVKLMRRQGTAGTIVNISSVAAFGSVPWLAPYAASKAALNVLTKNVAYSVMRDRIRVNAINLGWMDTPGEDVIQRRYHSNSGSWKEEAAAAQPFGRLLQPDEVARTVAYLASDESGMLTGALIDLDQSVIGAGAQPIPPPYDQWPAVTGVSFG